jgi:hypothetical protein
MNGDNKQGDKTPNVRQHTPCDMNVLEGRIKCLVRPIRMTPFMSEKDPAHHYHKTREIMAWRPAIGTQPLKTPKVGKEATRGSNQAWFQYF